MESPPRGKLARRLLVAMLLPASAGFLVFGLLAHEVARRSLEDELGRRLTATAVGVAAQILPEQILAIAAGDEGSRTFANLQHRLGQAKERLGVRRVVLLARDLGARGDTDGRVALGAKAHEFEADRIELDLAARGKPASSPLFMGRDGLPYKRGYASIGAAGFAVVEGTADFYAPLARFRRWLYSGGLVSLLVLLAVTIFAARRITRPIGRLARAAERIGRGDLEAKVAVETHDEIGALAGTLDDMRAALRARDERLQMMLAGIAHEVRNPLGGLELFAGLLREGLAGQPERLKEVERIEREIGYLGRVVTEFLEYARRPSIETADVALAPLLTEVREAAGARIEVEASGEPVVRGDRVQLRRAFLNLVRNAVSAAGEGGRVVVAVRRESTGAVVEVRDSGPGVPDELRGQIFQPFFTTHEKGTGLGLAFVRDIVRDHGGDVTVDRAPEGGACFRVRLPDLR